MTTAKQVVSINEAQHIATSQKSALSNNQRAFLAGFATCGTVSHAAKAAGINRSQHYRWLEKSQDYVKEFELAQMAAAEALEAEARRRAIEGTEEDVRYQGKKVGPVRRYSDILLIFLLKGALPSKYAERRQITGNETAPLVPDPGHAELSNAALEQLIAMAEEAQQLALAEKNE